VSAGGSWPRLCAKCKAPVSLAILHFAAKSEVALLVAVGAGSLIAFFVALAQGGPRVNLILAGSLSVVFASPWVLTFAGSLVASLMPMGMNLEDYLGGYAGKIEDITTAELKAFRANSFPYRIWCAYLWAVVNSLPAVIVVIVGLAVIYAFARMK
jgi:hypothetical protein